MKKIGSILLVFCILISIAPQTMWASDRIKVGRVSVDDSYGIIDVDFISRVIWSSDAKVVSVKDNKGKSYKGYLVDKDDDECEVHLSEGLTSGKTYTYEIKSVKPVEAKEFSSLKGIFTVR